MRDKLACNVAGESPEKKKRTKKAEGKAFTVLKTKKKQKNKRKKKEKGTIYRSIHFRPNRFPSEEG